MTKLVVHLPGGKHGPGAHVEHVEAIAAYAKANCVVTSSLPSFLRHLSGASTVFFQKSGLLNPILMLAARIAGARVTLYLHEPLSVRQRVVKGVPRLRALLVTLFQWFEIHLPHLVLTGNPLNRRFGGRQLAYAPLLFLPYKTGTPWRDRRSTVLYFGRLDTEKYFEEFRALSLPGSRVVASKNLNIREPGITIQHISIAEKAQVFSDARFVWCVHRTGMTQSGVVLEALRFGCCPILLANDPLVAELSPNERVVIPQSFDRDIVETAIIKYSRDFEGGPSAAATFRRVCGQEAFDRHWRPLLLSS